MTTEYFTIGRNWQIDSKIYVVKDQRCQKNLEKEQSGRFYITSDQALLQINTIKNTEILAYESNIAF
jgi:hypothetical protein